MDSGLRSRNHRTETKRSGNQRALEIFMGLARNALLWISENRKLRQALPKYKFIRQAVSRFMPGERLEDALAAAEKLKPLSIATVFTLLGENVSDPEQALEEVEHYVDILRQIHKRGLDTSVSVKLTHLGLDLSEDQCVRNLLAIVTEAQGFKTMVWIDMEQSQYIGRTVEIYKRVRKDHSNVGLCLQAYLYRTEKDLRTLLPYAPAIRIVKGAYKEPPTIAFRKESDVDENFFNLSKTLLAEVRRGREARSGHARHKTDSLYSRGSRAAGNREDGVPIPPAFRNSDKCTGQAGPRRVFDTVLISYGSFWFPWLRSSPGRTPCECLVRSSQDVFFLSSYRNRCF